MPGCPGLPLSALIHHFHLLSIKWRAEMTKWIVLGLFFGLLLLQACHPCSINLPICHDRKKHAIGKAQCLTLPFKPKHQQSRVSFFQQTDQLRTFSIMMAVREEMKNAAQRVSFDLAQSHPLIKERPVFAHRTKQQWDEKKSAPVECAVCLQMGQKTLINTYSWTARQSNTGTDSGFFFFFPTSLQQD